VSLLRSSDGEIAGLIVECHISVQASADCTGYSEQYLRRLLRSGQLKGTKVGPIWLIEMDSLEQHLANAETVDDRRYGPKSGNFGM